MPEVDVVGAGVVWAGWVAGFVVGVLIGVCVGGT